MKGIARSALAALAIPLAACTTDFTSGDAATDTQDVQPEDTGDTAHDVIPDSPEDTGPDTLLDPVEDTVIDTAVDTAVDTYVDSGVDTYVDSGVDTYVDSGVDTYVDSGVDTYHDPGSEILPDSVTDVVTDTWIDAETCFDGGTPRSQWLGYSDDYMNLDVPSVERDVYMSPTDPGWDFYIAYNGSTSVHSRIFQNGGNGVEIAHLRGRTFSTVTDCDIAGATFTTGLIDEPFDTTRTILIRTDLGSVYKVGNPVETTVSVTFGFAQLR